jgi:RHS repeat-associated protein
LTLNPNPGTTTVASVTFNLRYPGQYADAESGLNYNYFRSYDSGSGRYTQADPIGLDGGWNRFGYAGGNALGATDPVGLWSVEGAVYIGLGASMSLGRDPATGGTFMSFKFGKGFGWGATYDPLGGRAGGTEDQSCRAGVGVGLYAEAGGHAGPISGKVEANLGRNFFFGGGNDIYGGVQPKGSVDTNIRGVKGVAATGVEITIFGGRPSR